MNRLSTASFVAPSVNIGFRLFVLLESRSGDLSSMLFPDMPCMKKVYRDKKASVHWSAARKKERFSSR